jgi:hypothetical protein
MLQAQRGQLQLTLTNIIAGHQRKGQVKEARCRHPIIAKTARMRHPNFKFIQSMARPRTGLSSMKSPKRESNLACHLTVVRET